MKKKYAIPCVLLLSSLAVVPTISNAQSVELHAEAKSSIFDALAISAGDINQGSLMIDPLYPVADSSNTAGKGLAFTLKNQIPLANTDGFAIRIKNLSDQVLQTRIYISTGPEGYTLTNSTVDLYDLEGTKTSATTGFRFVIIPANFDGVAVIKWSTMVPYRLNNTDDWTNLAKVANRLVKDSTGDTAYPTGNATTITFNVEKNAANAHEQYNPFVISNIYTFTEEDSMFDAVKYENPLKVTANANLGTCLYPKTASTLLGACDAKASDIGTGAICIDPLDPVATTGDKGGKIDLTYALYIGAGDGLAVRFKNTASNTIKTKLYVGIESSADGKQNAYTLTGGTAYFYGLDGKVSSSVTTETDRTMTIPANFDGVVYIPWSSFAPYKYQGTTGWGNATAANKLSKTGTGMTAYPVGRLNSFELYIQKDAAHTTANENPFILNQIYSVTEGDGSFTAINHSSPFKGTTADGSANMSIYAYPTAKQTYEFRINGEKAIENDAAKFNVSANDLSVGYGEKVSFNPEAVGYSIASVTMDDTPISDYSFVNYGKTEESHVINITTSTTPLFKVSATFDATKVNFELEGAAYSAPLNLPENEKINVKVTAKEGYRITSVTVDGNEITLDQNGEYEFDLTKATSIVVKTIVDYVEYANYAAINSTLNGNAIVLDPTKTSGTGNTGGHIYSTKKVELANTSAIALRVKNLENADYVINTLYIQCTENYSYSVYDATIKFVSLDGTETTTSMTTRQIKVPANFDGYMVIDYNQLVEIKAGGSYFWGKRAADHLTEANYPTKNLDYVSVYFPINASMANVNEIVIGSDIYTVSGTAIKKYDNSLTITGNSIPADVLKKNYPSSTTTITCENVNVNVNKTSITYAETLVVSPKEGYTIESATLGTDNLTANGDGTYSIRVAKDYGTSATLTVVATQKVYYKVEATYNNSHVNFTVNETAYNSSDNHEENSAVSIKVEAKENYVIDSVKVNGNVVTLVEGEYEFNISANSTVEVASHLAFDSYASYSVINSTFDSSTIVLNPTTTTGRNEGGNIFVKKAVELAGTDAIVLRIKNTDNNALNINCIYIQCEDNNSYSTMGSTIKFVSLDGTETTTSARANNREVIVPANFDGYMVINYNQLVVIRTSAGWDWKKTDVDHLTEANYPTKNLSFISIYTSNCANNANLNEFYLGSDVYTVEGQTIKGYKNTLSLDNTSIVATLEHKYLPIFTSTISCSEANVTVNKETFSYGDTITVSAKEGYTLVSAKLGNDNLTENQDGSYSIRVAKAYDENVTLTVEVNQKTYYTVAATYTNSDVVFNINEVEYSATAKYEESTNVKVKVEAKTGYTIDSVKVNGNVVTLENGEYTFAISANSTVEVSSHLNYVSHENFKSINDVIDDNDMVFDPTSLSGAANEGGHIYLTNPVELNGTDAIALRVRNIENYDYIIHTLYLQCEDNYSYSTYDATIKFVSLDGTETTTSMTARQIKVPANFDGYMVIEYSQLVEIKAGGSYFWDKKAADRIDEAKYPTKKLSFVSVYFPINKGNEAVNEIVIGSDLYTISGETIKAYKDNLSLTDTTVVNAVNRKYFPVFETTLACENDKVSVSKSTVGYGDTFVVSPVAGYTITSAKLGDEVLVANTDGTYSYKVRKQLNENETLTIETAKCNNVKVVVDNKATVSLEKTEFVVIGNTSSVNFTVSVADGYAIEYVKANNEVITANEGTYSINVTEDVNIEVKAKIINYTITYNLDGGTNHTSNRVSYTIEDAFTLLDATKEGYEFVGWYVLDENNKKVEITRIVAGSKGNLVIYAVYEKEEQPGQDDSSSSSSSEATSESSSSTSESSSANESSDSSSSDVNPGQGFGCNGAAIPSLFGFIALLGTLFVSKKKKK